MTDDAFIVVVLNRVFLTGAFTVIDLMVANSSEQELVAKFRLKSLKIAFLRVSIEVIAKEIPESHEIQSVRKVVN